jgi:UDP-GlcNAc:undecaprenyl-phosphate/decaprenyl-phosphate GlcNAc-1-phosphate transferase
MSVSAIAFSASFVIALVLTPAVRALSRRHGLLDHPNERSSHMVPTPRSGGVAIVVALTVVIALLGGWREARVAAILGWGLAIAVLGAVDDVRSLPASLKFACHLGAAAATIVVADVILRTLDVPFAGTLRLGLLAVPVTLFWIVGVTNAFNFMDGINGIAAVEAIVCGAAYACLAAERGDAAGALFALAIAGAAAGFLPFNLPSGSIFMGDVGSGTLGFLFGVLALRLARWDVPFIAAVLPLFPFLFDATVTLVRRMLRRERWFAPHRTHFYQQLTTLGWSHAAVTSLWGALALGCSVVAERYPRVSDGEKVILLAAVVALHVAIATLIAAGVRRRTSA